MLAKTAALASALTAVLVACSSFSDSDPDPVPPDASIPEAGSQDASPRVDAADGADAADAADAAPLDPGCRGAVDCERTVFITSSVTPGTLINGIDGGDAICNLLADQSMSLRVRGRKFVAWLSTGTEVAKVRLVQGSKPYLLPNGSELAPKWGDFAFPSHAVPINVDENGVPVGTSTVGVWTGTNDDGTAAGQNCGGWASSGMGQIGFPSSGSDWSQGTEGDCMVPRHLYCVEL